MRESGPGRGRALRPLVTAVVLAFGLPLGGPPAASGYQLLHGGELRWPAHQDAIRYWVANRDDNWMSVEEVVAETRAAAETWGAVAEADLWPVYQGVTNRRPFDFFDLTNTIGFSTREHLREIGLSETTLAVTSWVVVSGTSQIVESDILVNPAYNWTDTPERGGWDYRSLVIHEFGHFLGLGHSNVGRSTDEGLLSGSAVMWPYSFGRGSALGRSLTDDDIAGISILYPGPARNTGAVRGRILRGGEGVAHAHVVAYEPQADHLVGNWAEADGRFLIEGLVPGRYVLRVNPLPTGHPPGAYFFAFNAVDTDFSTTVLPRFVVVRRDQVTEVDIEVLP